MVQCARSRSTLRPLFNVQKFDIVKDQDALETNSDSLSKTVDQYCLCKIVFIYLVIHNAARSILLNFRSIKHVGAREVVALSIVTNDRDDMVAPASHVDRY